MRAIGHEQHRKPLRIATLELQRLLVALGEVIMLDNNTAQATAALEHCPRTGVVEQVVEESRRHRSMLEGLEREILSEDVDMG